MGNEESMSYTQKKLNRSNFEFVKVIGQGGFGKVWKVIFKMNNKEYSMKEMLKMQIIDTKSVQNIIQEREILSKINHPLISNLFLSFQDYKYLYLVLDYLPGGNLRHHIKDGRKFNEDEIKFLLACMISSLCYLHSKKIIHRDVKPENLVFDREGYLRLIDFGIARMVNGSTCLEISGTPNYIAPEVLSGFPNTYVVDFYSVGVIGYELLNRRRPFEQSKRERSKYELVKSHKLIKLEQINLPSKELVDFLSRLMCDNPKKRLGFNGEDEIKGHPFLKGFEWDKLVKKELKSPFAEVIKKKIDLDKNYYVETEDNLNDDVKCRYEQYMERKDYIDSFFGYTFTSPKFIRQFYKQKISYSNNVSIKLLSENAFPTKIECMKKIQLKVPFKLVLPKIKRKIMLRKPGSARKREEKSFNLSQIILPKLNK